MSKNENRGLASADEKTKKELQVKVEVLHMMNVDYRQQMKKQEKE